jgi:sporulation protein YlmC with PRC-barrel domain
MRATELLGTEVVDDAGRSLGPVRDLRVVPDTLEVAGLVVGNGPFAAIAHRWGYAEGRARGPWVLRGIAAHVSRDARFVPADEVLDWRAVPIRITCAAADLPHLRDVLAR